MALGITDDTLVVGKVGFKDGNALEVVLGISDGLLDETELGTCTNNFGCQIFTQDG